MVLFEAEEKIYFFRKLIRSIKMPYVRAMESFFDDAKGKKVAFAKINNETSTFLLQLSVDIQTSNSEISQLGN